MSDGGQCQGVSGSCDARHSCGRDPSGSSGAYFVVCGSGCIAQSFLVVVVKVAADATVLLKQAGQRAAGALAVTSDTLTHAVRNAAQQVAMPSSAVV